MIMFRLNYFYVALVLSSSVAHAILLPQMALPVEPRNGLRVAANVIKPALRRTGAGLRTTRVPFRQPPRIPKIGQTPKAQKSSVLDLTPGIVVTHLASGTTVGAGSLIYGHLQNLKKDEGTEGELNKRNQLRTAAGKVISQAGRTVSRTRTRVPARIPGSGSGQASNLGYKAKKTALFVSTGLVAGAFENRGGQAMDAAVERFDAKTEAEKAAKAAELPKAQTPQSTTGGQPKVLEAVKQFEASQAALSKDKIKRKLYEGLRRRNRLVAAARLTQAGVRVVTGRTSGSVARTGLNRQTIVNAGKTGGALMGLYGASAGSGMIEGMIQNTPEHIQGALVTNPSGSISKLLPNGSFGKPKARRDRRYA